MNAVVTHNNKIDVTSGVTVVSSSENKIDVTSGVTVVYSSPMNVVVTHNNKIDVTSGVAVVPSSKFATTLTTILVATGIVLGYQNIEVPITEPITEPVTVDTGVNVDFVHQYTYSDTVHVMGHVSPDTGHKIQLNHTDVLTITSGVQTFIYEIPDTVEDIEVTSNIEAADGVTVEIDEPADTVSVYGQVTAVGMQKGSTRGRIAYYKDGRTDKLHYVIGMLNNTPVLGYGLRIGINNLPNDIDVDSGVEVVTGLPIIDDLTTDVTVTGIVDVAPPIVKATADWVDVDVYSNVDAVLKPELDIVYDSSIAVMSSSDFEYGHDHYIARTEYVDVLTDVGIMYTPPIIDTELIDVTSVVSANYIHHNIPTDQTINTISVVESTHRPTALYNDVLEQISVITRVVSVTIVLTPTDTDDIVVTSGVDTFFIHPVESVNDAVVVTSGTDVLFITPITHVDTVETSSEVTADFIDLSAEDDEVIIVDSGTAVQVFAPIVYEDIITTLTGIDHSYGKDSYIERTESLTTSTGIDVAPTPPYEDDVVVAVSSDIDVSVIEFNVEAAHIIDIISDIDVIALAPVADVAVIDTYTGIDTQYGVDSYLERTEAVIVSSAIDFMYILSMASEDVIDVLSQVDTVTQDLVHTSTDNVDVSTDIAVIENRDIIPTTTEIAVNSGIDTHVIGAYDDATSIDVYSNVDVYVIDNDVEIDVDVIVTSSAIDVMVTPPVGHIDTVYILSGIDTQYGVDSYLERTDAITISSIIDIMYILDMDITEYVNTTSQVVVEVTDLDAIAVDTVDVNTSIAFIENRDITPTTTVLVVDSSVTTNIISSYNSDTVVDVVSYVDAQVIDNNTDTITDNVVVYSIVDVMVTPPVDYIDTVDTLSGIDIHYGIDSYLERTDDITISSAMDIMYVLNTSDYPVVNITSQVVVEVIDLNPTPTDTIDVSTDVAVIENIDMLPATTEILVDSSIDVHTVSSYNSDTFVDVDSNVDIHTTDIDVESTTDSIVASSAIDVMVTPPVEHIDTVSVLSGTDTQYGVDSYLERTDDITVSSAIDLEYGLNTDIIEAVDTTSQVIVDVTDLDVTDIDTDTVDVTTDVVVMGNRDMLPATIDIVVDSGIDTYVISPYSVDTIVDIDSVITVQIIDNDVDAITDSVAVYSLVDITVLPPVVYTDIVDILSGADTQYGVNSYLERTEVVTASSAIDLMYILNTSDYSDINVVSQVLVEAIDLNVTYTDTVDVITAVMLMENKDMLPETIDIAVDSLITTHIISPYSSDTVIAVDSVITVQTIDTDVDTTTDSIITSSLVDITVLPPVEYIDTVSVSSGADTQYGVDSYLERTEAVIVSSAIDLMYILSTTTTVSVDTTSQVIVDVTDLDVITTDTVDVSTDVVLMENKDMFYTTTDLAVDSGVVTHIISPYSSDTVVDIDSVITIQIIDIDVEATTDNVITSSAIGVSVLPPVVHTDIVNTLSGIDTQYGVDSYLERTDDITVSGAIGLMYVLNTADDSDINVVSQVVVDTIDLNHTSTDNIDVDTSITLMENTYMYPVTATVTVDSGIDVLIISPYSGDNVVDVDSNVTVQTIDNNIDSITDSIITSSTVGVAILPPVERVDTVDVLSGIDTQYGVDSYLERTEVVTVSGAIGVQVYVPISASDTVTVTTAIGLGYQPIINSADEVINVATQLLPMVIAVYDDTVNIAVSSGINPAAGLNKTITHSDVVNVITAVNSMQGLNETVSTDTDIVVSSVVALDIRMTTSTSDTIAVTSGIAVEVHTMVVGVTDIINVTSGIGIHPPIDLDVPTTDTVNVVTQLNPMIVLDITYTQTINVTSVVDVAWGSALSSSDVVTASTGMDMQVGVNSYIERTETVTASSGIDYTIQPPFNITLNKNGGSGGTSSITGIYSKSITPTSVSVPSRTGYTFKGYYTETSGGTQRINSSGTYVALTNTIYSGDATLYAQWTSNPYTITLDKQSGTGGTNSIAGVYDTSLTPTSVTVPTRSGYNFAGYYTATSGGTQRINTSGTYVALTSTTYSSSVTLYARWTPATYSITLNQLGGSGASLASSTYTHSTSYQAISFVSEISSRTGYMFYGWDVKWADGNNSEGKTAGQVISNGGFDLGEVHLMAGVWGNIVVEAVWGARTYTITLDKNGGSGGDSSITSVYDTSLTPTSVSVPSRTGYTFTGYYTETSGGIQRINSSGTYVALTSTTYTSSPTLYARWTSNTYTITLDKQSGTGGTSSITSVYGTSLTPTSVTVPTRAGYDFVGYYNSTSGGTQRINASGTYVDLTSTTYSTNATLYARWALGTYSITLNQLGGSGASITSTYTHSTSYQAISFAVYQSSRPGHTFHGWDVKWADGNNSEGKVAGQLLSDGGIDAGALHLMQGVWGNLILEAVWSQITHTITLNKNGGSGGTNSIALVYGTSLTPTSVSVPTRTGYNFAGYYTSSSGGTQRINNSGTYVALYNTTYSNNVTLYARWTRKSYTITLNKQSGTGGTSSIAGVYGSSLTPTSVTVPTRSGYTFQGYYTTAAGGTQRINASGSYVSLTSTTYSANVTLYARWAQIVTAATPTLTGGSCVQVGTSKYLRFTVTNNDTSAATIRYGITSNPAFAVPGGTLAPGATRSFDAGPYSGTGSITVYVKAQVSGKTDSGTTSRSGSLLFCQVQ